MNRMTPSPEERYSRQILFREWGEQGQQIFSSRSVVVVGCGALGTFQAAALARAGIGRLRIVDRDYVELSNLQRQWMFDESAAESVLPKAIAAQREIRRVNPLVEVEAVVDDLTARNVDDHLAGAHLILDGTDNFETRYLLNEFAVRENKPWIYGGAVGSYGIAMPVIPGETACLSCIYPCPPAGTAETCDTIGVLNTITAMVAAWQVSLAFRVLLGNSDPAAHRITNFDVWRGTVRQIPMPARDPQCHVCGKHDFPRLAGEIRVPVSLCGRNAVQIHDRSGVIDLTALRHRLETLGTVRANEFALRFSIPGYDLTVFPDGRAIIKGTQDVAIARSLYARYIGS